MGRIQVRGNGMGSACSLRTASQRKRKSSEDSLNGSAHLILAATKGGRWGGHSVVRASCAQPGDGGGNPNQVVCSPIADPGDGGGGGGGTQQRMLPVRS